MSPMTTPPKTTWKELENLSWDKQRIYDTLNLARDNAIHSLDDLVLNQTTVSDALWCSHNVLKGGPITMKSKLDTVTKSTLLWELDNSKNLQPSESSVTEKWKTIDTATLSIGISPWICLDARITIHNVAESDITLTIDTEAVTPVTRTVTHDYDHTWNILVGPHEKVKVEKVEMTNTGTADYLQKYGFRDDSCIGVMADESGNHIPWRYNINHFLCYPSGTIALKGHSKWNEITFRVVRIDAEGNSTESTLKPSSALRSDSDQSLPSKIVFAHPAH